MVTYCVHNRKIGSERIAQTITDKSFIECLRKGAGKIFSEMRNTKPNQYNHINVMTVTGTPESGYATIGIKQSTIGIVGFHKFG